MQSIKNPLVSQVNTKRSSLITQNFFRFQVSFYTLFDTKALEDVEVK